MVELPDDAIEEALVEGFGQARWDAMNGAEQHEARDLFGPMAASIAACVHAEAVAEHRAELEHRIEVSAQIENDRRLAQAEQDEYRRLWQEAERRVADLENSSVGHRMVPGSHERPSGAECACSGAWDRWMEQCVNQKGVTCRG